MKLIPGPETRAAIARNPVLLACAAVVALLGLTAGVLVIIDSARDDTAAQPAVQVEPQSTATTGPIAKTAVALGVTGTTRRASAVRERPGSGARVSGTLQRNTTVTIDGRTDADGWYRIVFPPNSELHGWIDADDLTLHGDTTSLAVVTPEPPIVVEVPTERVVVDTPTPEDRGPCSTDEQDCTPTPAGTPEPGLPDLVVSSPPIITQGKLFVTVVNQGQGDFAGDLVVAIFNLDGTALLGGATLPDFSLPSGSSIDVGTGYEITKDQQLLLIVDPNGEVDETDNANNSLSVSIALGEAPDGEPPTPVAGG